MLRIPAPLIGALDGRREPLNSAAQKETAESLHHGNRWKLDLSRPMRRKLTESPLQ